MLSVAMLLNTIHLRLSIRLILAFALTSAFAVAAKPVILDTDIGSDIDDTWALLYLLNSPELDLQLIVTATAETSYKAKVAAKYLEISQRSDVVVGLGLSGEPDAEFQQPFVSDYSLTDYPGIVRQDGITAMIELIHASEEPITLIVLGPTPNIAEALRRDPTIASKVHFIGMHGSIDVGYEGASEPSAEWNVASHLDAFRTTLAADWLSFTLTPLDTCGDIIIRGDAYQTLKASTTPELTSLFKNYHYWADRVTWEKPDYLETRTSVLYDLIPVYLAYSGEFVNYETVQIIVDDEGIMRRSPDGHTVSAALSWNQLDGFYEEAVERLLKSNTAPPTTSESIN